MSEPALDFGIFSVADAHVANAPTTSVADSWTVDGIALDQETLLVISFIKLTRASKRYRIGGGAAFTSREGPIAALDQQALASFVRIQASRLTYSHLRGHLNALAGIVGEAGQFPPTAPLEPELLRSSEGSWQVQAPDDAYGGSPVP